MRFFKIISAGTVMGAFFLLSTASMHAKPEYAKTEKKSCTTCHVKNGSKDLNDVGKQYKETKKLPASAK